MEHVARKVHHDGSLEYWASYPADSYTGALPVVTPLASRARFTMSLLRYVTAPRLAPLFSRSFAAKSISPKSSQDVAPHDNDSASAILVTIQLCSANTEGASRPWH